MDKKKIFAIAFAILALILVIMMGSILETNTAGYFQVKQAAITGNMSVRLNAGTYWQWFGTISTYKNVATVGIGEHHVGDGSADIDAVDVIFNDGSKAKISGLIRVKLPQTEEGAIHLKNEYAGGFEHFIQSGVVPIVNNAIKLSANLRSAQDAYTTLALFQQAVEDQLRNGIYVTKSDKIVITRSTGDTEEQRITAIVYGKDGQPLRMENRLQQLGCEVLECVIDVPQFDQKVEEMIAKRKDEAMKTELAKQEAIRAQQDALTAEQQGLANVAKAKYEKEVEKVKEVTTAQKEFEVAVLNAKKAEQEKLKKIEIAKGIAEELRIADGLSEKEKYQIDAKVKRDVGVAEHLSKWVGPRIIMTGNDNGKGSSGIENALMIKMMDELISKDK